MAASTLVGVARSLRAHLPNAGPKTESACGWTAADVQLCMSAIDRRAFLGMSAAMLAAPRLPEPFITHEWGVLTVPHGASWATARSAAGEDPHMPSFVTDWNAAVGGLIEKWENEPVIALKPVIHFYSSVRRTVDVRLDVPAGRPKLWHPPATEFGPEPLLPPRGGRMRPEDVTPPDIASIAPEKGYLLWKGLVVDPEIDPASLAPQTGWWQTARGIDSTPVAIGGTTERFVFYDALTLLTPTFAIDWKDGLPVTDRPGARGLRVRDGKPVGFTPDEFAAMLAGAGLFESEARRVAEIWTREFFETDGARVLAVMTRTEADAVLPLRITPEPDVFERVLVLHVECLTPERRAEVDALIERLGSDDAAERDDAMEALRRGRPWVDGPLRETRERTRDLEVRTRIDAILR